MTRWNDALGKAQILRGLDDLGIELDEHGVDGQYHEGQEVIKPYPKTTAPEVLMSEYSPACSRNGSARTEIRPIWFKN